jgi:hypothetical protein
MANAKHDQNSIPTLIAVSSSDGVTPVNVYADPTTHRLKVDTSGGSGTVTSVSVVTANGFAGSVADPTTTPAINISTTINAPVLAGNGTAISAATTTGSTSTVVLQTFPTLITPLLGTPTSGNLVNCTGYTIANVAGLGTGVATALAVNVGSAGAFVVFNGALGTPSSGTVTNLTGTASININGTVGANTPAAGSFTSITMSDAGNIVVNATTGTKIGTATSQKLAFYNSTPIVQPTGDVVTALQNLGLVASATVASSTNINTATESTDTTCFPVFVTASGTQTLPAKTNTTLTYNSNTNDLGVTKLNGLTITASTGTLTITNAKTISFSNSITFAGTDSTTMTFPTTTATIARTDAAQTFTGTQTFSQIITTPATISVSSNAGTVTRSNRISNFTNSSAATMTITMSTTSAADGDMVMVVILDASAAAQTITWVNTENSTVTAPTTSNGSTTLPLTVGFKWNAGTSKWRCIASA